MKLTEKLEGAENFFIKGILTMVFGALFWLVETIVFLFIDGWHVEAISPVEKYLDMAAMFIFWIGQVYFVLSVIGVMSVIFSLKSSIEEDDDEPIN